MKLAEALLRRKELQDILSRMETISNRDLYEVKAKRVNVTESLDDIVAQVPKMTYEEFDREYKFYSKQLREIDGHIQQANWTTELTAPATLLNDYEPPKD